MLDVRRLRLLRELAHRGTIAAVADALAYTPSAVSQQLAALEREAGVPLLARTGRRVELTAAGRMLVGHAEAVLARLEQASSELADARTGLVGPLRIGAFPTAMRTIVPPALVALGRDHPGLELTVTELDPAAMSSALRTGTLDVGLLHEYDYVPPAPDPALQTQPLAEETMYLASSTQPGGPTPAGESGSVGGSNSGGGLGSVGAFGSPVGSGSAVRSGSVGGSTSDGGVIGGCRDLPWILNGPDTVCHAMVVRACQAAGFVPRVRHQADDFATVLALVAAGQGVAVVPRLGALDPPEGVGLTPLASRRRTLIAYRGGTGAHPAVAACASALHASVAEHRAAWGLD
jgi:DNA-binding transcriptional LysR family regulator